MADIPSNVEKMNDLEISFEASLKCLQKLLDVLDTDQSCLEDSPIIVVFLEDSPVIGVCLEDSKELYPYYPVKRSFHGSRLNCKFYNIPQV